jgi:hypothetical protein
VSWLIPVKVAAGGAAAQLTVLCVGVTAAVAETVTGPVEQSKVYVALLDRVVPGLVILIAAQPVPAVVDRTAAAVTRCVCAPLNVTVWTGPVVPDEYTHW